MKHRPKAKKLITCLLCLTLCCLLALGSLPAQAEEASASPVPAALEEDTSLSSQISESSPAPSSTEEDPESSAVTAPTPTPSPSQDPEESQPETSPTESPAPSETPSPTPSPTPEVKRYTVTFQMGSFGSTSLEVEEGQIPSLVPEIQPLPAAAILGWFNEKGEKVDPATLPITGDVTYTARWGRNVEDLLNTEDHSSYISGYDTGLFCPDKAVTRAEAATMFYNLLRSTDWEKRSFSDVKETDWYAEAVETLAGLGVVSGYEDGTFKPTRQITRAEFVTMAMAFSTLEYGESPFSDVEDTSWAAPYIYTAHKLGWVNGMGEGEFSPNSPVNRAQAVTILNKMLGRQADAGVKELDDVKNFYDLFPEHWGYAAIVEASTSHTYHVEGADEETAEVWDTYEKDESTVESHWVRENGKLYYVDSATRKVVRGETTINGVKYVFDSLSGAAFNGFRMDGDWRRYYQNGTAVNDISGLGVVSGPYYIKVYKPANYLIIFAKDPATGKYNTPVRSMLVSCGYGTPTGTYYTPARYRWLKMVGDTWAQWCTQIQGSYLFHSVPNWTYNNFDLEVEEYNRLGQTRSLGCIRLNCRDAKWIYDNCQLGTQVYISPTETDGPLKKPSGLQLPSWHTWDPTDPTAYYACQQRGCH